MTDALLAFAVRCAVTAFDLHTELSRDGRTRGLWVYLREHSKNSYANTQLKWFEDDFADFMKGLVKEGILTKAQSKKHEMAIRSRLFLHLNHLKLVPEDLGTLMEWPEAIEFHKRMGLEIEAARERGEIEE